MECLLGDRFRLSQQTIYRMDVLQYMGDYYIWDDDSAGLKVVAFAYMKDLNDIPSFPKYE